MTKGKKDIAEEMNEGFMEGTSNFPYMKRGLKEDFTHSSNSRVGTKEEILSRKGKNKDPSVLEDWVAKLEKKIIFLARFTVKMIHRSVVTLFDVIKENGN